MKLDKYANINNIIIKAKIVIIMITLIMVTTIIKNNGNREEKERVTSIEQYCITTVL